jgi:hypothetical protein
MNPLNVSIVPAQPGHELIFKGAGPSDFELRGQVLAWRITTWPSAAREGQVHSKVEPLDANGELGDGYVGVVNPDNTVVMFGDRRYSDWDEYRMHSGCASLSKKLSWAAK